MAVYLTRGLRRLVTLPFIRRSAPALYYASGATASGMTVALLYVCIKMNLLEGMFFPPEGTIPTDVEQATGLEKKEIDALMAGVEVGSL